MEKDLGGAGKFTFEVAGSYYVEDLPARNENDTPRLGQMTPPSSGGTHSGNSNIALSSEKAAEDPNADGSLEYTSILDGPPAEQQSFSSVEFEEGVRDSGVALWDSTTVQMGKLLGSGYFGEVYSAKIADGKSPSTRLDVALKRITKQKFRNKNDVQLFMHEIIIHSKLLHRNILPLLGVCRVEGEEGRGDYFMITPFMAGGSLNQLIKKRPSALTPRTSVDILFGVATGMKYLHGLKPLPIVHRDLTSNNILLDNSARPVISDFGLSRFRPLEETMTGAVGSLAWMSPEVFRAERYAEPADVFSFAVVCYEVFTKRPPCPPSDAPLFASLVALKNHRLDLNEIPSNISHRELWQDLIGESWKANPSARPTFDQIVDRIRALLQ